MKDIEKYNTWSDISLEKGKQIMLLHTGLTENQYISSVYGILTDGKDYKQIPIDEVSKVDEKILKIISSDIESKELKLEYCSGKYYLEYDLSRIPWGMFIDLEILIQQSENNIYNNIEQIIACLVRERKHENKKRFRLFKVKEGNTIINYELEEYDSIKRKNRAEEILKEMNMVEVNTIMVFFCKIGINYIRTTLDYSQQKLRILNKLN